MKDASSLIETRVLSEITFIMEEVVQVDSNTASRYAVATTRTYGIS